MLIQRRAFLAGLGALFAAPAIVRASSLMPVKPVRDLSHDEILALLSARIDAAQKAMAEWMTKRLYGDVADIGPPPLPLKQSQYVRYHLTPIGSRVVIEAGHG